MNVLDRYSREHWEGIQEHIEALMSMEEFNAFAAEMIRYQMSSGGKRIRPVLVLMIAEAFGGSARKSRPFAATVELIHNASLVHDDIQDKDMTRRGKPSAWVTFSMEQAINLGDILFVLGFEAFNRMEIPDSLKLKVMSLTIRGIGELCDGQVYEFVLKDRERVQVQDYVRLVSGKTGSLFRLACKGGYALSGDTAGYEEEMKQMGEHIGIMFQVRDDLLDAVGSKEGRRAGGDVAEGKISYPAVHFMGNAEQALRRELLEILRTPRAQTTEASIQRALDMYRQVGSLEATLDEYTSRRRKVMALGCVRDNPAFAAQMEELLELLDPRVDEGSL